MMIPTYRGPSLETARVMVLLHNVCLGNQGAINVVSHVIGKLPDTEEMVRFLEKMEARDLTGPKIRTTFVDECSRDLDRFLTHVNALP